jgi:hypothetical protein
MLRGASTSLLLAGVLLAAGCATSWFGNQQRATDDPLRGGPPLPAPAGGTGAAQAQAQANAATPAGPLPVMAAPATTTSSAALAGGVGQTLNGGSTLSVLGAPADNRNGQFGQPQSVPASAALPAEAPVMLSGNVVPVTAQASPAAGAAQSSAGFSQIDSYMQAQQALLAHGVTTQNLLKVAEPDIWRFVCSIPDRHDLTNVTKFSSGDVPGDNGLNAIRTVLSDIERSGR